MLRWILPAVVVVFQGVSSGAVLLREDFEADASWGVTSTDVLPDTPLPVEPTMQVAEVGTINEAGSTQASRAMLMTVDVGESADTWQAVFNSGLLSVTTNETHLGKLTLSFDLSASIARPVIVRIESFDSNRKRTGALETMIYPAAPDFYVRSAIDLSSMKPSGAGTFAPTDPFVRLSFVLVGPDWPAGGVHQVRVDNVNYSTPAIYVSPLGNNNNDGLTEATALSDPQKAIDRVKPGDIVLLMEGEYGRGPDNDEQEGVIEFLRGGEPAAWVVLKNYPGHRPIIRPEGWNGIRLGRTVKHGDPQPEPMAYIEIRGLHIRGENLVIKKKYPDDIGKPLWTTNGNGIGGTGQGRTITPHHLRLADNLVELCPGGGLGVSNWDWVVIENNVSRNNCWFTIYACSGIGTLGTMNFDATDNVYKVLIRNNRVTGNRCYIEWKHIGKVSDGNGIIVDSIYDPAKGEAYLGRTLIQNNVVAENGGSGIHCFKAQRVDIVNNSAFRNGATPQLAWGQIFFQRTSDARLINNILYARNGQPVNTVSKDTSDRGNVGIIRGNNIYFSGGYPAIMGEGDAMADPEYVSPWSEPDTADFRVMSQSPARGHGKWHPFVPLTDIDGNRRPLDRAPDAGAYQTVER